MPDGHAAVARVGKPFGVRGEVYVFADPDLGEPFDVGTAYARTPGGGVLTVGAARQHGGRLVVAFREASGREGAESIRGTVLSRPREELSLEEGAVWVADLVGRGVVLAVGDEDAPTSGAEAVSSGAEAVSSGAEATASGAASDVVGRVVRVVDGFAHDYLLIELGDGREVPVPMVPELVDWSGDPVVVEDVPGLLDPDEAG